MGFPVALFEPGGRELLRGECTELFADGMYVSAASAPSLFTRVRVRLELPGGRVECEAAIVRAVSSDLAAAWQLPVGCAVHFLDPSKRIKEAVPPRPRRDAELQHLLRGNWNQSSEDHYGLLVVSRDADLKAVRQRVDECQARLMHALTAAAGPWDRALVQAAIERVTQAGLVLCDLSRRAEYDAARGNFRGVARCIGAGLSAADLERFRKQFLAVRPRAQAEALARSTVARLMEATGQHAEARIKYEQALGLDPLNLKLHLAHARAARRPA